MERRAAARVLIAGGGVAALEAAIALRTLAEDRVTVELLASEPHFWYRPLAVAEPFALGEARRFELSELAASASATFSLGSLVAIDTGRRLAHTRAGAVIAYDILLVACGAVSIPAVRGALTFRGPADTRKLVRLLAEAAAGDVGRLAIAVPSGAVWSLPAYELALLTERYLAARGRRDVELTLVTSEEEPLQLFGLTAIEAIRELLESRGIHLRRRAHALEFADGELRLLSERKIMADRVVALPRLYGTRIDGLPRTVDGFVPVDLYGRVRGVDDVFAAGDVTSFPVKQGGLAAQQADAAAATIAAAVGADVAPRPFRPVLRGMLLTGTQPLYFRHELTGGFGEASWASTEPLWWPPAKIVGRHLAPLLAERAPRETATARGAAF